ncbi:Gfo/Idh/MocA family oxidoreductase [Pedobacter nutrimenti]|uniref:Gfo/Idh/MocA family oxidoreductase n=1 Tax=Pedobacter nutrimenti TaxID=1241337 RepID=UPI00292FE862|nr:Gfo/Idh/MocA family oxidoreductase [Pedobacter nutrimenti]
MERVITTGLLAYGMSGKVFHAPFIDAHPGFKLYAVTERHQKQATTDYPGVISYTTIDDLLDDQQIELVVINTPNFTHFDFAKKALQKGKHILVEKPFAATAAEAQELFDLARSVDKKVFVYQNRRWDSDFIAIKKVLEEGTLGKLSEVHFRFDRYRASIGPKTFKEEPIAASGLQYDLGPHLLDQVISIFGKPLHFHKVLGKNRVNTQVDDFFSIHLSYPDSVNVFVHANMLVTDIQPAFVIHGTKGSLIKYRADVQEEQLLKGIKPTEETYGAEEKGKEALLTVLNAEGQKEQVYIPSEKGNYLPLFEAVYDALTKGKPYPVEESQILTQITILES